MATHKLSQQAQLDRRLAQRSLYYLCKEILGYKDLVPHVHADLCHFLTAPEYGRFRQACVPRSWFKTWVATIGGSIWMTLPDEEGIYKSVYPFKGPDARILIASNIFDNAAKMIDKIRREWMTNDRLQAAFPEIRPCSTRWSNECAEVTRPTNFTEGTYTSIGAGGGVVSQHFDLIIEDDLIYARKDDFNKAELLPNQEDIDKAIGWHKLTHSLFVNPQTACMWNIGTRWAPHDIVDYIRTNEHAYSCFEITATVKDDKGAAIWPIPDNSFCVWPERFDKDTLEGIRDSQTIQIFETQYLNRPRAGQDVTFDISYLKTYDSIEDFPEGLRYYTFVDLAGWSDKKGLCNNVVLTGAKDQRNHVYIARIDAGRYTPSEVITKFKEHQQQFNSKVLIEEVQYQTAIRHFAKIDMDNAGRFYNLEQLPNDARKNAKELRIQALEPYVKNGAVHVLKSMKQFIQEMEDYPYASTKDRLDCAGMLLRHARPSIIDLSTPDKSGFFRITREDLEKECKQKARSSAKNYPFSVQLQGNTHVKIDW